MLVDIIFFVIVTFHLVSTIFPFPFSSANNRGQDVDRNTDRHTNMDRNTDTDILNISNKKGAIL
jgi:hypothetical protein